MTPEEFNTRKNQLERELEINIKLLASEYAISNNPYPIGTIVTDQLGSLKIEKIKATMSFRGLPQCVYSGIELKKDGTPMKKQTGRYVWQENIQIFNNKKV